MTKATWTKALTLWNESRKTWSLPDPGTKGYKEIECIEKHLNAKDPVAECKKEMKKKKKKPTKTSGVKRKSEAEDSSTKATKQPRVVQIGGGRGGGGGGGAAAAQAQREAAAEAGARALEERKADRQIAMDREQLQRSDRLDREAADRARRDEETQYRRGRDTDADAERSALNESKDDKYWVSLAQNIDNETYRKMTEEQKVEFTQGLVLRGTNLREWLALSANERANYDMAFNREKETAEAMAQRKHELDKMILADNLKRGLKPDGTERGPAVGQGDQQQPGIVDKCCDEIKAALGNVSEALKTDKCCDEIKEALGAVKTANSGLATSITSIVDGIKELPAPSVVFPNNFGESLSRAVSNSVNGTIGPILEQVLKAVTNITTPAATTPAAGGGGSGDINTQAFITTLWDKLQNSEMERMMLKNDAAIVHMGGLFTNFTNDTKAHIEATRSAMIKSVEMTIEDMRVKAAEEKSSTGVQWRLNSSPDNDPPAKDSEVQRAQAELDAHNAQHLKDEAEVAGREEFASAFTPSAFTPPPKAHLPPRSLQPLANLGAVQLNLPASDEWAAAGARNMPPRQSFLDMWISDGAYKSKSGNVDYGKLQRRLQIALTKDFPDNGERIFEHVRETTDIHEPSVFHNNGISAGASQIIANHVNNINLLRSINTSDDEYEVKSNVLQEHLITAQTALSEYLGQLISDRQNHVSYPPRDNESYIATIESIARTMRIDITPPDAAYTQSKRRYRPSKPSK